MKRELIKRGAALLSALLLTGSVPIQTARGAQAPEEKGPHELAEEMVQTMPLRQKLAQMIMLDLRQWTDSEGNAADPTVLHEDLAELLRSYSFAGVCLFAENVTGTQQAVRFTAQLQTAASESQLQIPLIISADQEGGSVIRLGTGTDTCGNMALGAAGDPDLALGNAQIIGSELRAVGFNADLAPDMDVNSDPRNPVINIRSFSSDPQLTAKMGAAFIEGLDSCGIISTAKHFPGHGNTDTDSHTGLPLVESTYEELKACELIPFQAAIDAGADMIMSAHIQFPQIESSTYTSASTGEEIFLPATLSKTVLTDILRGDMGFEGVIITDDMQMAAVRANFDPCDAAVLAINAGADILLEPVETFDPEGVEELELYLDKAEEAVSEGLISESRIDESCTRIIEMKIKRGLFDESFEDVEERVEAALGTVGSQENHLREMEISKQAVTLVKNSRHVLPLSMESGEKVAFFYPYQSTGNSLSYAFGKLKEEGLVPEDCEASFTSMDGRTADEFAEELSQYKAVILSSETWGEWEISPKNSARSRFISEMTELAHDRGVKVIVLSMVLPYDTAAFSADAVLAAYNQRRMPVVPEVFDGELTTYGPNYPAAVYTVFGGSSPSGRLPVEVCRLDGEHRYTEEVLYPLGWGMSYPQGLLGDFYLEVTVDAADASGILSSYAMLQTGGAESLSREELSLGDLDGDGRLDASDASLVLSYYAFIQTGGELTFIEFLQSDTEGKTEEAAGQ